MIIQFNCIDRRKDCDNSENTLINLKINDEIIGDV